MDHFNRLDPEVAELLAILAEECGEVTQRVGKVLRHGIDNHSPYNGDSNRSSLEDELTDVLTLVELLSRAGVIDRDRIHGSIPGKLERLGRPGILHHSSMLAPTPCVKCGGVDRTQVGPPLWPRCLDRDACQADSAANQSEV